MLNTGKVSIIMPVYNGERYLKYSISSVLKQSYDNFELIIVDDASIDCTQNIIKSYTDARIKIITLEKGMNIAYAGNCGLEIADGEYIARIDCDDIWESDKLEKQIQYMQANPEIGACFTRVNVIDDAGMLANDRYNQIFQMFNSTQNKNQKEWVKTFFLMGNFLCNSSVLIRTEVLNQVGRFYNLAYVPGEDFELWTRVILKYPIYIMDEKLVQYRWTEDALKLSGESNEKKAAFENVHMLIRWKYLDNMMDEMFICYFADEFVDPEANTCLELEIEKAFLLLKCADKQNGKINFLGLQKLCQLVCRPDVLEVLQNKYDFDMRSYYKLYQNKNFFSYDVVKDLMSLEQKNSDLFSKCNEYEEKIDKIETMLKLQDAKVHLLYENMSETKENEK